MMAQAELPEHHWAEAVATAAYLRNRIPTRSLKSTTPYEKWFKRKLNLGHIRVFGCMCYAYIAQAVGTVSKFNSCHIETHLTAVKQIFRYLKGTINFSVKNERSANNGTYSLF